MFYTRARIRRGESGYPAWTGTDFAARRGNDVTRKKSFDLLLESLYDAMLDDDSWPAASGVIDEYCGTKGNSIVTGDGDTAREVSIFFARICHNGERRDDLEQLYFDVYHETDERVPRIRVLPDSELAHVDQLYTDEEKRNSPAFNEALPKIKSRDGLSVRMDGTGGSRIVLVLGDPTDRDGWSTPRVAAVRRLLPHLRQYGLVRQLLIEAQARVDAFGSLLEAAGCGVIQLDRDGRVIEANDSSLHMLGAADGLTDADAVLQAGHPSENYKLQRLLARALLREGAAGGSTTLRRKNSSRKLSVHVMPLQKSRAAESNEDAAALVLISKTRADTPVPSAAMLEEAFGLTAIEAQLVVLLAKGHSIREIAELDGRSYYTVRWHIQNVFQKLGVSRQAELVRLVFSLSWSESR